MSQLQHSPGPWTYDEESEYVRDAEGSLVADVMPSPHHGDARLIAAAPDMLRLLRVLVEMSESGADTKDEWYVWRDAMQDAKALIARLDGGE